LLRVSFGAREPLLSRHLDRNDSERRRLTLRATFSGIIRISCMHRPSVTMTAARSLKRIRGSVPSRRHYSEGSYTVAAAAAAIAVSVPRSLSTGCPDPLSFAREHTEEHWHSQLGDRDSSEYPPPVETLVFALPAWLFNTDKFQRARHPGHLCLSTQVRT
jgi:hypothetical protein